MQNVNCNVAGAVAMERSFDSAVMAFATAGAQTGRSRAFTSASLSGVGGGGVGLLASGGVGANGSSAASAGANGLSGRRFWAASRRLPREPTITGVDISRAATELLQVYEYIVLVQHEV